MFPSFQQFTPDDLAQQTIELLPQLTTEQLEQVVANTGAAMRRTAERADDIERRRTALENVLGAAREELAGRYSPVLVMEDDRTFEDEEQELPEGSSSPLFKVGDRVVGNAANYGSGPVDGHIVQLPKYTNDLFVIEDDNGISWYYGADELKHYSGEEQEQAPEPREVNGFRVGDRVECVGGTGTIAFLPGDQLDAKYSSSFGVKLDDPESAPYGFGSGPNREWTTSGFDLRRIEAAAPAAEEPAPASFTAGDRVLFKLCGGRRGTGEVTDINRDRFEVTEDETGRVRFFYASELEHI